MSLLKIPPENLYLSPFTSWDKKWFLLTAGDFASQKYNCMTVSWGSFGTIWNKPFAQVFVRPTRYTYEFINSYPDFTLCAFPETQRKHLQLLGAKSGREIDKLNPKGLTASASTVVGAPGFAEAELILECRKLYWDDIEPGHFLLSSINSLYGLNDHHRSFFAEVLAIHGTSQYFRPEN
jgi:flavin reductase (DIM6/NTAB) family NADH-FMN oxidoreductase RutF